MAEVEPRVYLARSPLYALVRSFQMGADGLIRDFEREANFANRQILVNEPQDTILPQAQTVRTSIRGLIVKIEMGHPVTSTRKVVAITEPFGGAPFQMLDSALEAGAEEGLAPQVDRLMAFELCDGESAVDVRCELAAARM